MCSALTIIKSTVRASILSLFLWFADKNLELFWPCGDFLFFNLQWNLSKLTAAYNEILYKSNFKYSPNVGNLIDGVTVSVLSSSVVDRGFETRSGETKDYKIGICCFFARHAALRRKSKDLLARNQNNVSEWSNMSTCRLLFQWTSTIKIKLSVLV